MANSMILEGTLIGLHYSGFGVGEICEVFELSVVEEDSIVPSGFNDVCVGWGKGWDDSKVLDVSEVGRRSGTFCDKREGLDPNRTAETPIAFVEVSPLVPIVGLPTS